MLLLSLSAQKEIDFSTKTMFSQIKEGKFTENIPLLIYKTFLLLIYKIGCFLAW